MIARSAAYRPEWSSDLDPQADGAEGSPASWICRDHRPAAARSHPDR